MTDDVADYLRDMIELTEAYKLKENTRFLAERIEKFIYREMLKYLDIGRVSQAESANLCSGRTIGTVADAVSATAHRDIEVDKWIRQNPPMLREVTTDYHARYAVAATEHGWKPHIPNRLSKFVKAAGFRTIGDGKRRCWVGTPLTNNANFTPAHTHNIVDISSAKQYTMKVAHRNGRLGLIYIVDAPLTNSIKIGKTTGNMDKIRKRYITPYGNMMTIYAFPSTNIDLHEKCVHDILTNYRICQELFTKGCLSDAVKTCAEVCSAPPDVHTYTAK